MEAFLTWITGKGLIVDGAEIRSGDGNFFPLSDFGHPHKVQVIFVIDSESGNGVFATKTLSPSQIILRLPKKLMITAGAVASIPRYQKMLQKLSQPAKPFDILTLFFCVESEDTSKCAPYLRVLPKKFDTPAAKGQTFDPSEMPLCARSFYEQQLKELESGWTNISQISDLNELHITHDRFLWAWHVVNTRCIFVENDAHPFVDSSDGDTIAVIPYVDMFNHSPYAQSSKTTAFKPLRVCPRVKRLWFEYGFKLVENPSNKVMISPDLFIFLAKKIGINVTPKHEKALAAAGQPNTIYASDEGPSWSLRANMQILLLPSEKAKIWKDFVYSRDEVRRKYEKDDDSDDDDVVKMRLEEGKERAALLKMLQELQDSIRRRADQVHQDLGWVWLEQEVLVANTLKALEARQ